jgi:hypothetical protein
MRTFLIVSVNTRSVLLYCACYYCSQSSLTFSPIVTQPLYSGSGFGSLGVIKANNQTATANRMIDLTVIFSASFIVIASVVLIHTNV